jgi:hypothetical protein
MSLGQKRFHNKVVERENREVTREESKQMLEEMERYLAQRFFAFVGQKLARK